MAIVWWVESSVRGPCDLRSNLLEGISDPGSATRPISARSDLFHWRLWWRWKVRAQGLRLCLESLWLGIIPWPIVVIIQQHELWLMWLHVFNLLKSQAVLVISSIADLSTGHLLLPFEVLALVTSPLDNIFQRPGAHGLVPWLIHATVKRCGAKARSSSLFWAAQPTS